MKPHLLTTLLLPLLLGTGCETWVTGGTKIQPPTMAALEVGTPYAEAIAELGPPLMDVDGGRVIAYPWDTKGCDYPSNPLATLAGFAGACFYASVDVPMAEAHLRYHALALKFDGQQKLLAWRVLKSTSNRARLEALRDWAAQPPPVK